MRALLFGVGILLLIGWGVGFFLKAMGAAVHVLLVLAVIFVVIPMVWKAAT